MSNNLILNRDLVSADIGLHQWTITATQNDIMISIPLQVQVNNIPTPPPSSGESFVVNGSLTPSPVKTGTNITISIMNDSGGNYFRILNSNGGEVHRSNTTSPGNSQITLPLIEENQFQQQAPVPAGIYIIEYDQGGSNTPVPIQQIELTVTS